MQKLLLVNEYDVRQIFELRPEEAQALFYSKTIKFCLADTLRLPVKSGIDNGVVFHVTMDEPESWAAAVNATIEVRRENGETNLPEEAVTSDTAKLNEANEADDALAAAFQVIAPPDSRRGGSTLN